MLNDLKKFYTNILDFLTNFRGLYFFDLIEKFIDRSLRRYNNQNFDYKFNGERIIIKKLSKSNLECFLDIGANKGDWSIEIANNFKNAKIFSFEISQSTFNILNKNISKYDCIKSFNYGIGSISGDSTINVGDSDEISTRCEISTLPEIAGYYHKRESCEIKRADEFIEEYEISSIDYVKIDTEGFDLDVIKSFGSYIKIVKIFQFEYGAFNILSRDLLFDFYSYFKKNGFTIGKVYPRMVKFCDYSYISENFYGSNYIALNNNHKNLKNKLSRFHLF